jgi:transcriptional regulator with XRE-family HTH domain
LTSGLCETTFALVNRIRAEREARGWRVEDLASKAGVSFSSVIRLESGANTSMGIALKVATAFGLTLNDLFPAANCLVARGKGRKSAA